MVGRFTGGEGLALILQLICHLTIHANLFSETLDHTDIIETHYIIMPIIKNVSKYTLL